MAAVGVEGHVAVDEHGKRDDAETGDDDGLWRYDVTLEQLRGDGREDGDDESAGAKDAAGVDGAIAIGRLEHLGNEGGRAKKADAEDEEENAGDGEVAVPKQAMVDDWTRSAAARMIRLAVQNGRGDGMKSSSKMSVVSWV
jgi:hypothetical protein